MEKVSVFQKRERKQIRAQSIESESNQGAESVRTGLLGGDGGTTVDELGHDTSNGLDTLGKRSDIEQQNVASGISTLSGQDTSLDGGTVGNGLIGVDSLGWFLASKELRDELLDLGDTGGSSDKDNLVDLALGNVGIVHDASDRSEGLLEEIVVELLETSAGEGLGEVKSVSQVLNLETGLLLRGKGTLDTLHLLTKLLKGTLVAGNVNGVLLLHHLDKVLHDTLVKVLSSQVGISVGGQHLKDSVVNGQEGHIEGSSAQVKDKDIGFSSGLVHAVGNGGGSGFVDDTLNLHTRNGSGILGGLALGVVKVGGHSNDGVLDFLSEKGFGRGLHLLEDHGGDLFGGKVDCLAVLVNLDHGLVLVRDNGVRHELLVGLDRLVGVLASNQPLDVKDGVGGVDGSLVLGGITHQTLTRVNKGNVGGGNAVTLVVGNNLDTAILEDSDTGVGCSKINSNNCAHGFLLGNNRRGGKEGHCKMSVGDAKNDERPCEKQEQTTKPSDCGNSNDWNKGAGHGFHAERPLDRVGHQRHWWALCKRDAIIGHCVTGMPPPSCVGPPT